jgi:hypothetical protein
MSTIGSSVVQRPTADTTDFHLFSAGPSSANNAFAYIYAPLSATPALTVDLLRLDCLPRSPLSLDEVARGWLEDYSAFADAAVTEEIVEMSANGFLMNASFVNPIIDHHNTSLRYIRWGLLDFALQFLRRLDPITRDEVEQRDTFLYSCSLPERLDPRPPYSEYAARAQQLSEEIGQLTLRGSAVPRAGLDIEFLQGLLAGASPLHNSLPWAILARFFSQQVLANAEIDKFDVSVNYLRLALVALYDSRKDGFLETVLYKTIDELADTLMLTHSQARPNNLMKAAELYRTNAERRSTSGEDADVRTDVMSLMAAALVNPEAEATLVESLPDAVRIGLRKTKNIELAVDQLLGYSERLRYIARRSDLSLCLDACRAADLAQALLETTVAEGGGHDLSQVQLSALLNQTFQAQVDAQRRLYDVDLDKVSEAGRLYDKRNARVYQGSGRAHRHKRQLVYLRPLGTSRRIRVGNSFGRHYARLIAAIGPLPVDLSLEGALQMALGEYFRTVALGGPIDIFGMGRQTALGNFKDSGLSAWQEVVSLLIASAASIVVLLRDSQGLLWELSEVTRQDIRSKVVIVVPPGSRALSDPESLDSALMRFALAGFTLPTELAGAGFLLMNSLGAVETEIGFDALWNGQLLRALRVKAL